MRSALVVSNSGNTGFKGETRQCYNCGEVGHMKQAYPKPPKDRDSGGRGQSGGRGRNLGGKRGRKRGYWATLMVAEVEEEAGVVFTEEDQALLEVLRRKQIAAGYWDKKSMTEDASTSFLSKGNTATYAHSTKGTGDTHALASISITR